MTEDTEWNDVLKAKGILLTEEKITEMIEDTIAEQQQKDGSLENLDLDELDALEDEEDDRVLASYRRARLAQLKDLATKEKYGSVQEISKTDYATQVSEASKESWVIVHLYQNAHPGCKLINALLERLAPKHKAVKFLKIVSTMCIENYPDKNLPTLLVYGHGDLKKQLIGMASLGGVSTNLATLEQILASTGALEETLGPTARFQISRPEKETRQESDEDEYA